jgi:hypothetical protein
MTIAIGGDIGKERNREERKTSKYEGEQKERKKRNRKKNKVSLFFDFTRTAFPLFSNLYSTFQILRFAQDDNCVWGYRERRKREETKSSRC